MKECIFQEIKTAAGKKFLVSDSAIDSNERQCAYVYACVRAFKDTRTRVRVCDFVIVYVRVRVQV